MSAFDERIFADLDAGRFVSPASARAAADAYRKANWQALTNARDRGHDSASAELSRLEHAAAGEPIPPRIQAMASGRSDPPLQAYQDYLLANWQAFNTPSHPDHAAVSAQAARIALAAAGPGGREPIGSLNPGVPL